MPNKVGGSHADHWQFQVRVFELYLHVPLFEHIALPHPSHGARDAEARCGNERDDRGHAEGNDEGSQHSGDCTALDPRFLIRLGDVGKEERNEDGGKTQVHECKQPDQHVLRDPGPQQPVPGLAATAVNCLDPPVDSERSTAASRAESTEAPQPTATSRSIGSTVSSNGWQLR
eukprot:CAMPEP_0171120098 /NCGR_PEP_ID=MMETSP0766_2-20121228/98772_1 /TAXON_ID=439317 /ORGANISM="Gambierdiscus australes, Strain CAWD 149" /LENGTH=172 /DNA_ID=CAMNT_0011582799 /DNA_START=69 /DNA_END=584 /DNA_ORIENTATION=+